MGISAYHLSVLAGKTAVVAIVLLALYRVLGKRNLAQFSVYDLVTVMAVANAVQNAMTAGRGQFAVGLVCSATLLLLAYGMTKLFTRLPMSERLVLGIPILLISDGQVLPYRLRREQVSREELQAALRQHGVTSPHEVAMAVLELDGTISVIPKGRASRIESKLI
jgi:uncharacterized membrane protein YcaP (DUF421 family)